MTEISVKQIDEILKRHSTINDDDCPQFTIVMENGRVSKIRASKFIIPARMSKRLTLGFQSRISQIPNANNKKTSFVDNMMANDMIMNQIQNFISKKPDNLLFDYNINEKKNQQKQIETQKEKQNKSRKTVTFQGSANQQINNLININSYEKPNLDFVNYTNSDINISKSESKSESDKEQKNKNRKISSNSYNNINASIKDIIINNEYDQDNIYNQDVDKLLLGKLRDFVQKMTKDKYQKLVWDEKQKLLELLVKIKQEGIQRAFIDNQLREAYYCFFSSKLNKIEDEEQSLQDYKNIQDLIKNIIVYVEESHIKQSNYYQSLQILIKNYSQAINNNDEQYKNLYEILKQSLLYFKLSHYNLTNTDTVYERFYSYFDSNIDILLQERTQLQRRTLQTNILKQILEKGFLNKESNSKQFNTNTKIELLKNESSNKTASWKKKSTQQQMKNIYGFTKQFKI